MKVHAVIFDWAGTTIDYGCFSPLGAFVHAFKEFGIDITFEQAREPMGMLKLDHIKALLAMPTVKEQFVRVYGRDYTQDDVHNMYQSFEKSIFVTLKDYVNLNPFVLEAVAFLKSKGIKIGSTTGYTKEMMDIIIPIAKAKGYAPECCVTSDELGYGRPYPYMMYECARRLNVYPQSSIVKIGDTVVDMQEGRNAGCKSIGLVLGSSILGLSYDEVQTMDACELENHKNRVRAKLYEAGADIVIDDLSYLASALEQLEK